MTTRAAQATTEPSAFNSTAHVGVGLFVSLIAGVLIAGSFAEDSGMGGIATLLLGVILGLVGQVLITIGIIAKGVNLGNRESR